MSKFGNSNLMCEETRIGIYVLEAGRTVKEVLVNPSQTINAICALFPNLNYIFIWKGKILCRTNTFGSYGIESENVIIALKNTKEDIKHWITRSLESESLHHRVMTSLYPSILIEKARLSDMKQMHANNNPKFLRRYYRQQSAPVQESEYRSSSIMVDYIKPTAPGCQPITIAWN